MNKLVEQSFDLEQQITSVWSMAEDLSVLAENVLEKDATPDQIANVLIGMKELYIMKYDKMFELFEQVHAGICELTRIVYNEDCDQ